MIRNRRRFRRPTIERLEDRSLFAGVTDEVVTAEPEIDGTTDEVSSDEVWESTQTEGSGQSLTEQYYLAVDGNNVVCTDWQIAVTAVPVVANTSPESPAPPRTTEAYIEGDVITVVTEKANVIPA